MREKPGGFDFCEGCKMRLKNRECYVDIKTRESNKVVEEARKELAGKPYQLIGNNSPTYVMYLCHPGLPGVIEGFTPPSGCGEVDKALEAIDKYKSFCDENLL